MEKKTQRKSSEKSGKKENKLGVKNSLVNNINARKKRKYLPVKKEIAGEQQGLPKDSGRLEVTSGFFPFYGRP